MKTRELTGAALDWAVAKSLEATKCLIFGRGGVKDIGVQLNNTGYLLQRTHDAWVAKCEAYPWFTGQHIWAPSTNWAQGGPLIEEARIVLMPSREIWVARIQNPAYKLGDWLQLTGPTPLIAAMRAYVASKLGAEIELPQEIS